MAPTSLYEILGGETVLRSLVDRFYDLMNTLPEAKEVRELHPQDLTESRDKLFMFLSGWMGGPQLFLEKFGHPRLRARHLPFVIGERERDQWMSCMRQAMSDCKIEANLARNLETSFMQLATHMINHP